MSLGTWLGSFSSFDPYPHGKGFAHISNPYISLDTGVILGTQAGYLHDIPETKKAQRETNKAFKIYQLISQIYLFACNCSSRTLGSFYQHPLCTGKDTRYLIVLDTLYNLPPGKWKCTVYLYSVSSQHCLSTTSHLRFGYSFRHFPIAS